jgi:hypothetical protein
MIEAIQHAFRSFQEMEPDLIKFLPTAILVAAIITMMSYHRRRRAKSITLGILSFIVIVEAFLYGHSQRPGIMPFNWSANDRYSYKGIAAIQDDTNNLVEIVWDYRSQTLRAIKLPCQGLPIEYRLAIDKLRSLNDLLGTLYFQETKDGGYYTGLPYTF